ncbi:disulfide bond formation protein B [Campylobacter fetus]|uniref:disulfide bond formation protein B n=1 Tax=Campylobacter fetus TaxID=196 RepID=UPI0013D33967|nr:disulfide bond formation protein B [Campylobacter fetus]
MRNTKTFYLLFSLAVIGILALPVGIANFIFGYILGDSPCTLCWGQRQSMIYIGVAVLFVLRYGFKPRYLAMILIITAVGLWESFYHLGNHALEDVGQGFGVAILGLHTQFWAEVVFWSVVFLLGVILFFAPNLKEFEDEDAKFRKLTIANIVAFWVFFIVVASNIVQAFVSTGPPPFLGQGDPVRYSWNSKYTIWSAAGWKDMRFPTDFLGKRDVNFPDLGLDASKDFKFDTDYSNSPIVVEEELAVVDKKISPLELNSPISDLNYQNDKMLVSTEEYGLYITDRDLTNINSHLVLDKYFSATVERFAGANFVGDNIRIMGINKTSVDVKENPSADKVVNFPYFLEGADKFDEIGRYRLKTSRAKNYYVLTSRSDKKHTYMITVPNNKYKELIVISTLNSDKGLSAEFIPELGDNVKLKDGRSLGELYISALAIKDDMLYALSKAYNTLLVIDPKDQIITKAYGLPKDILNIRAMTFVDGKILISSYENGKDALYTLEF